VCRRRFHCLTRAGALPATAQHSADRAATPLAIEGQGAAGRLRHAAVGFARLCPRARHAGATRRGSARGPEPRAGSPRRGGVGKTSLLGHLSAAAEGCRIVRAEVTDGLLRLSSEDDGVGGADPVHGSGLVGLRDRVEAVGGGTVRTQSEPGQRTWLLIELPLGPAPGR
jgi:hypothetical protein